MSATRREHGWGAYFWPYLSFLGIVEFSRRFLPEAWDPAVLPIKVAIPLGLLAFYFARGHYPELRGYRTSLGGVLGDVGIGVLGAALWDVGIGVLGAALWMAPYLASASLRPEEGGFDPDLFGPQLAWLALLVRAIGYGVATPFIEELFVRSWLVRYIDVMDGRGDFRDVPIARYSRLSFAVILVWFTVSHMPWEWPVAAAWLVMTQLWFYHRKHLMALVIVHAASNLSILAFVIAFSGRLTGANGEPIDLWFFV
jgi:hypothetical protein